MKKQICFGTDGIRGKANEFPFTKEGIVSLGRAISTWANIKYNASPSAIIAYDTRVSSPRIKEELIQVLNINGINTCDAKVLPTPAILQLINSEEIFDFGVMISASHNHFEDNGIKLFSGKNGKLSSEDEADIEKYFVNPSPKTSNFATCRTWNDSGEKYKKNLLTHFKSNFLLGKNIVLDCANGATYRVAKEIFVSLGAKVKTIACNPNGNNINENCGTLHTQQLQSKVKEIGAYAGFAFDGDGDRVIAVNKNGEIRNGDDLLSILLSHSKIKESKTVVGTVMTNHGFEKHLNKLGKQLIRTKVGDKYVSAELETKNIKLGGEASGHIIMNDYLPTGDGIFAALRVLESMIENNNVDMETFEKFPQVLVNVPVSKKKDLQKKPYADLITEHEKVVDGRVIVRYSGTENVLRVMAEDKTQKKAAKIASTLATILQKALN